MRQAGVMAPSDGKTNRANTQQDYGPKVGERRAQRQPEASADADHLEGYPSRFPAEERGKGRAAELSGCHRRIVLCDAARCDDRPAVGSRGLPETVLPTICRPNYPDGVEQ